MQKHQSRESGEHYEEIEQEDVVPHVGHTAVEGASAEDTEAAVDEIDDILGKPLDTDAIKDLMNEIDDILGEENAEEFVDAYEQVGGE